ncbi:Putative phage protein [Candidatus Fokinia solitaria]|uniref:Phage protein n=1 Tax=Candidatus Fokinia solitaria TaxID=1802984 RepID=A0A2U8BRW0_9RICK|nr:DUF2163 domain-containing protein [Candidatus Fokinia solitaria]AWD33081.1 Putative phage protein [Candidatus Fokinia solitaria]
MKYIANLNTLCFKIVLRNEAVLGFTNCDQDIEIDDIVYQKNSVRNISKIVKTSDLADEEVSLDIKLPHHLLDVLDVMDEVYDGSTCSLFSIQLESTSIKYKVNKILYCGTVQNITLSEEWSTVEIASLKEFLRKASTDAYSTTCRASFCDSLCGKDKDLYTVKDIRVEGIERNNRIRCTSIRRRFDALCEENAKIDSIQYRILLHYGNITFRRMILSKEMRFTVQIIAFREPTEGLCTIELAQRIPSFITQSDTFDLMVGCNKIIHMCQTIYQNRLNFRGEPQLPNY